MNHEGSKHLTKDDRLMMEGALRTGAKPPEIAKMLGKCVKTIYNEIKRGLCVQRDTNLIDREVYCADVAERKYQQHLREKGPDIKLGNDHALANFLEEKIVAERFSPGAALAYIRENGLVFQTEISEKTLYNYIYRGDVFLTLSKKHLLYQGRNHRKKEKGEENKRARQPRGETIERRPEEVQKRVEYGHWEMDSIVGCRGSRAALLVLTERLTRMGIVIRLPDHTAASVVRALNRLERRMGKRFRKMFRSITVDNGCEFQDCEGMESSMRARLPRTKIYYCHPYSSYERGSNENMNRIIRRFFPKGTNFDLVSPAEVAAAEHWMNHYPRKLLGWRSAASLHREYETEAA